MFKPNTLNSGQANVLMYEYLFLFSLLYARIYSSVHIDKEVMFESTHTHSYTNTYKTKALQMVLLVT